MIFAIYWKGHPDSCILMFCQYFGKRLKSKNYMVKNTNFQTCGLHFVGVVRCSPYKVLKCTKTKKSQNIFLWIILGTPYIWRLSKNWCREITWIFQKSMTLWFIVNIWTTCLWHIQLNKLALSLHWIDSSREHHLSTIIESCQTAKKLSNIRVLIWCNNV